MLAALMYLNMTREQTQATQACSRWNLLLNSSKYAPAFFLIDSSALIQTLRSGRHPALGKLQGTAVAAVVVAIAFWWSFIPLRTWRMFRTRVFCPFNRSDHSKGRKMVLYLSLIVPPNNMRNSPDSGCITSFTVKGDTRNIQKSADWMSEEAQV